MEAEDCAQNEPRGDPEGQKAPWNPSCDSAVDTVSSVLHVLTCQQTLLENAKRQLEAWNRGDVISVAELATEAKRFVAEAQGKRKAGETIKEVLLGKLLDDLPDCMLDAVTRLTRNSYDQEVERGWRGATQAQQDRHAHKRRGQAAFTAALLLRQRDMHAMPRLALAMGIDRILSTGTYREHDIMCMLRIMPSEAYIRKELEALGRDWRGPSLKDDGEEPSKLYEVRSHIIY